jgi:N-acetylglutamate synthase-like GNAT family acetyltransferase
MIRSAGYKDTKVIVELLQQFLKETSYAQADVAANNREHLSKITWATLQHGNIWLAEIDEVAVGLLAAIREPNMWSPRTVQMREICWYVLPEYRSGTIGGRLFKTYCATADSLLESGKITGYFTTKMSTTDDIDLGRRGFRLTEQTFLKELKGE